MASTKISNPVKFYDEESILTPAKKYKAIVTLIDKTTKHQKDTRGVLWENIKSDLLNELQEHEVYGNYEIPLVDSEILKVPMSVDTAPLTEEELQLLEGLDEGIFDDLFEKREGIIAVEDQAVVMTQLMTDPSLQKMTKVSGGKMIITLEDPTYQGLTTQEQVFARTSFFGLLGKSVEERKPSDKSFQVLVSFLENRLKGSFKTGNRVSK